MSRPMVGHRSAEFSQVLQRVESKLKDLFETDGEVFVVAGSGTAAMESAVANLLDPNEKALVITGGKFGERWVELVESFGAEAEVLAHPYGTSLDPEEVAKRLDADSDLQVVFATHNESSTAVMNDIQALAEVTRTRDRLLAVDAVSSLGGAPLPMDLWGVDVVVSGSQKCLMLPPGLGFVAVNSRAWQRTEESKNARYYFDWRRHKKAADAGQNPYTPAVSLIFGLDEALTMLSEEGKEERHKRHRLMRNMIRAGLEVLGFPLYVDEPCASPTLTAARGGDVDPEVLRKIVAEKTGVVLSGGQGELQGEIFRVGHMGAATPLDMVATLGAIERALAAMGRPVRFGHGVGRALEVWHEWR